MRENRGVSSIEVSAGILFLLVRYLQSLNMDVEGLFRSLNVDPDIMKTPEQRIPFETYIAIEDEAARISGDPSFGLHMGEFIEPSHYSIIGYMMMSSRTLREAIDRTGLYYKIVGTLITSRAQIGLTTVKIIFSTSKAAPRISRHCYECVASSMVTLMRKLSGRQINPRQVGFAAPAPENPHEYTRFFHAPVLFNQKQNYIVADTSLGNTPVLHPNPHLLDYLEGYAKEYLARIEGDKKTTRAAAEIILSRLENKKVDIRDVARELCMSVRTLQNRLRDEGTIFRDLLGETREDLAKKYLRKNYSVEEISYFLGYAETSVFSKAFKKWSGKSPKEYREMLLAQ